MGFGLFLGLPILIAQWIGVIGLGKGTRNPAWWCMVVGTGCSTLGSIGSVLFLALLFANNSFSSHSMPSSVFAAIGAGALSGLGSLLFSIGFAIHGQQGSNSLPRIAELEAIAAAQGEELNRLRPPYTSAS
jgi:hypothetical protein